MSATKRIDRLCCAQALCVGAHWRVSRRPLQQWHGLSEPALGGCLQAALTRADPLTLEHERVFRRRRRGRPRGGRQAEKARDRERGLARHRKLEALDAEQDKTNRLERETVRLNEESTRLQELRDKQDGQVESLSTQVQDLRRSVSDKDAEITKFNATAKQLSQHIAELETNATKSGHLIETTAGEKQRLTDELKVATQQLDMMREVTRQLYAKITEQVRRVRTMIAL